MNVLVYSGSGTTAELVKHVVDLLRFHLLPYYAVVTVSEQALINDPWMFKTACLVVPGGADLPYCRALNGAGNAKIMKYVRGGGRYLGFCAGGYYASARCEFEVGTPIEVTGPRELAFFPGTCRGCAYKGFVYGSHRGARVVPMISHLPEVPEFSHYYNGGGVFCDAKKYRGVDVLASYPNDLDVSSDDDVRAAVVHCVVGKGLAILTGTHPEFSHSLLDPSPSTTNLVGAMAPHGHNRRLFMKLMLERLGLRVNQDLDAQPPRLTPVYVVGTGAQAAAQAIREGCELQEGGILQDKHDVFQFSLEPVLEDGSGATNIVFPADPPLDKETPYFLTRRFLAEIQRLQESGSGPPLEVGAALGYGEVVTSTNTLMDQNPGWLKQLPHGFTITATTQTAGRGRGGNVWINPRGVMATLVLFRVPPQVANLHQHIVTLQYALGLALIEAILGYGSYEDGRGVGYEDMPVRLKWPNDIYVLKPEYFNLLNDNNTAKTVDGDDEKWAKILGALVNSQHIDGVYHLVWGAGVNVLNEAPTTSLNTVLELLNVIRGRSGQPPLTPYSHELLLAKVLHLVNLFYFAFERQGLHPFLPLYYKRWFHLHQIVLLLIDGTTRKVCIEGITPEFGCLVARDVTSGDTYELQPDGNSFDIFKGLVYKKTA